MENKQKQSLGIFNILTILLCILLAVSIVFIVVMNGQINDLKQTADSLTDITASTSAGRSNLAGNRFSHAGRDRYSQSVDRIDQY